MGTAVRTAGWTATGRRLAGFTAALLAAGAMIGTSSSDASPSAAADQGEAIACGGYAADGDLVRPLAATTTHAIVHDDGTVEVPDTCGGYTEDGQFIGDD